MNCFSFRRLTTVAAVCVVFVFSVGYTFGSPAASLNSRANVLLSAGKSSDIAITLARQAVGECPTDYQYHVTLANAYTYRAAVILYSLFWSAMISADRDQYSSDFAAWSSKHPNPLVIDKDDPIPVEQPQHVLFYKDGSGQFRLGGNQAVTRILELNSLAQAQWSAAERLAVTKVALADVCYKRAWSVKVLGELRPGKANDFSKIISSDRELNNLPSESDAAKQISIANRLQPKNALYWQSRGDLYSIDSPFLAMLSSLAADTVPLWRKYYRKSLNLQPKNENLWLTLADRDKRDGSQVQDDLLGAVRSDPHDSFALLSYAGSILKTTGFSKNSMNSPADRTVINNSEIDAEMVKSLRASDWRQAVKVCDTLNRAAHSTQFNEIVENASAPPPLRQALVLSTMPGLNAVGEYPRYAKLRAVARDAYGVAIAYAARGDASASSRLLNNVSISVSPMYELGVIGSASSDSTIKIMVAAAIKAIALKARAQICQKYGSKNELTIAERDYNQFKTIDAIRRTRQKALASRPFDIYSFY